MSICSFRVFWILHCRFILGLSVFVSMANSSSSCILNVTETSSPDRGCILPQNVDEFQHFTIRERLKILICSQFQLVLMACASVPSFPMSLVWVRFSLFSVVFCGCCPYFCRWSSFSPIIPYFFPKLSRFSPIWNACPRLPSLFLVCFPFFFVFPRNCHEISHFSWFPPVLPPCSCRPLRWFFLIFCILLGGTSFFPIIDILFTA